jgi:hypothetical protein
LDSRSSGPLRYSAVARFSSFGGALLAIFGASQPASPSMSGATSNHATPDHRRLPTIAPLSPHPNTRVMRSHLFPIFVPLERSKGLSAQ